MHDRKLMKYRERQHEFLTQMWEHSQGDECFYLTASKVLNPASRALELFESSEVDEKRALLHYLLQSPLLVGRDLVFELKSPFDVIAQQAETQNWLLTSNTKTPSPSLEE